MERALEQDFISRAETVSCFLRFELATIQAAKRGKIVLICGFSAGGRFHERVLTSAKQPSTLPA